MSRFKHQSRQYVASMIGDKVVTAASSSSRSLSLPKLYDTPNKKKTTDNSLLSFENNRDSKNSDLKNGDLKNGDLYQSNSSLININDNKNNTNYGDIYNNTNTSDNRGIGVYKMDKRSNVFLNYDQSTQPALLSHILVIFYIYACIDMCI